MRLNTIVAMTASLLATVDIGNAQPSKAAEIGKAVKQCIATVHAADFAFFDAFYNTASGMVETNVTPPGSQQAYLRLEAERGASFIFRKCMAEKGFPLK